MSRSSISASAGRMIVGTRKTWLTRLPRMAWAKNREPVMVGMQRTPGLSARIGAQHIIGSAGHDVGRPTPGHTSTGRELGMKAVVFHEFGGPEVLREEEVP